jgi:hypothetical protein
MDEGVGIREKDEGSEKTDNRGAYGICFWEDG